MPTTSEELLRESLLDLDRARAVERARRRETEQLLHGLKAITDAEPGEVFDNLIEVLSELLELEGAFIVVFDRDGLGSVPSASHRGFRGVRWELEGPFLRALERRPVTLFDVDELPAWRNNRGCLPLRVKSALLGGITTPGLRAVLVCTHSDRAFFTRAHARMLRAFSPIATQALLRIKAREREHALLEQARWTNLRLRREIGERISAERQLRQTQISLIQSEELSTLSRLIVGITHELESPLSFIADTHETIQARISTLQGVLREHAPALDPATREHVDALFEDIHDLAVRHQRGTTRVSSFLRTLVEVARMGDDGAYRRTSVDDVIRESLTITRPRWRRLTFTHRRSDLDLECRPLELTQALMNLIDHAADAACSARGERDARVAIEASLDDDDLLIHISDNSGRFAEETWAGFFDPLLPPSVSRPRRPSRLPLAISRNIAREHRGALDCEAFGDGTRFTLRLPREQRPTARA